MENDRSGCVSYQAVLYAQSPYEVMWQSPTQFRHILSQEKAPLHHAELLIILNQGR